MYVYVHYRWQVMQVLTIQLSKSFFLLLVTKMVILILIRHYTNTCWRFVQIIAYPYIEHTPSPWRLNSQRCWLLGNSSMKFIDSDLISFFGRVKVFMNLMEFFSRSANIWHSKWWTLIVDVWHDDPFNLQGTNNISSLQNQTLCPCPYKCRIQKFTFLTLPIP